MHVHGRNDRQKRSVPELLPLLHVQMGRVKSDCISLHTRVRAHTWERLHVGTLTIDDRETCARATWKETRDPESGGAGRLVRVVKNIAEELMSRLVLGVSQLQ